MLATIALAAVVASCQNKGPAEAPPKEANDPNSPDGLIRRGMVRYQTNCIACHNADPHKPGAVGPEIYGASLPLLEERVLRAGYPPGYKPKRGTHMMAALPHLKEDLPALHAFLNAKP